MIRTARTVITTVPTADMKRGIFPFPVYDPFTLNSTTLTRQPFANNTIPQARWDTVGAKLLQLYPDPNLPGLVNNYAGQISSKENNHQVDVRGDYVLSTKDTLFARYSYNHGNSTRGSVFGAPGYGGSSYLDRPAIIPSSAWSVVGGHTRVFSAAWANELRLGYTHNESNQLSPSKESLYSRFGILGVPNSDKMTGLPTFLPSGYSWLGDPLLRAEPEAGGPTLPDRQRHLDARRAQHTLRRRHAPDESVLRPVGSGSSAFARPIHFYRPADRRARRVARLGDGRSAAGANHPSPTLRLL